MLLHYNGLLNSLVPLILAFSSLIALVVLVAFVNQLALADTICIYIYPELGLLLILKI